MIILVASIIFILILMAFMYAWKKEKESQRETEALYDRIRGLSQGISDIGYIKPGDQSGITSKVEGNYIKLNGLSRVYKYSHSKEYWIEFVLENITMENFFFVLDKVEFSSGTTEIESNLTLLLEKVPEYVAPPYGNSYFDTKSYNNFILGTRGHNFFTFQSRFCLDNVTTIFNESDFIRITAKITRLNNDLRKYEIIEKVRLEESFKNMRYKTVQAIDEQINWNE